MAVPPPPRSGHEYRPASHLVPLNSGSAPRLQTDYESLKIIGNGSYGSAILCSRRNDDKLVVVKVLRPKPQNKEKSQNEIRILKQLVHVNIVRYFDHWQEGDRLYIAMEYAEDGDLRAAITCQRRRGRLFPEPLVLLWLIQLTSALYYVHSMRVLHRDIKSNNIFLAEKGRMIKLGDFGISKQLDESGEFARTVIGTPYYLSPEMVDGKKYNSKSDIWAVGVLLFEMLTFEYPYQAATQQELFSQIRSGRRSRSPSGFSKDLIGLLDLLLEPDRRRRPSARQLLRMPVLRGAVGGAVLDRAKNTSTQSQAPPAVSASQVREPRTSPREPRASPRETRVSPREPRGQRSPLPPPRGGPPPAPPSRGTSPEVECPVCLKKFAAGDIHRHANVCVDRRGKARHQPKVSPREVLSPPATTPQAKPPARREEGERAAPRRAPATRRRSQTTSTVSRRSPPASSRRPNAPKKTVAAGKSPAKVAAPNPAPVKSTSPGRGAAAPHSIAPPPPPPSPPPPPPPSPVEWDGQSAMGRRPPAPTHRKDPCAAERRSPTPGSRVGYSNRGVSPPASCVTARSHTAETTQEDAKSSSAPVSRRGGSALSSSSSPSPSLQQRLPPVEVRPSAFLPPRDASLRTGGAAWWTPLKPHTPTPLPPKDPLCAEARREPAAVPVLLRPTSGGGRRGGYRGAKEAKEEILSRLRGAPPLAPVEAPPPRVRVAPKPNPAVICSPPRRPSPAAHPPPSPEDLPPVRRSGRRPQPSPPTSPMSLSVDVDASGTSFCSLTFSELPLSSGLNAARASKAQWAWIGAYIPPAAGSARGRRGAAILFALLRKTRCLTSTVPVIGFVPASTRDPRPTGIPTPPRAQRPSMTPSPHSSEVSACSPVRPAEVHRALRTPDIIEVDGDDCSELARSLAETLKEVDSLGSDDDDGDFDDQMPQMLSLLSCVQFDGFKAGKLQVTGITDSDSLSTQAEGLGKVLEEELGFDTFIGLYRMLAAENESDVRLALGNRLLRAKRALGASRVHLLHLMVQLIQFTTNFHKQQHLPAPVMP